MTSSCYAPFTIGVAGFGGGALPLNSYLGDLDSTPGGRTYAGTMQGALAVGSQDGRIKGLRRLGYSCFARGPSESGSDLFQVAQHLSIRSYNSRFMVRYAPLLAELPDDGLDRRQLVSWYRWEQVVFDLVVQPTVYVVDSCASAYIPGGKHLTAQKTQLSGTIDEEHTLMIRSKYRTHINSDETLVHQDESDRIYRTHELESQPEVKNKVPDDRHSFSPAGLYFLSPHDELGTICPDAESFNKKEGKEKEGLVLDD